MAKIGEKRPTYKYNEIGYYLSCYTNKTKYYDEEFNNEIRAIAPEWFDMTNSTEKKQKLLFLAQSGIEKLEMNSTLRRRLYDYTSKNRECYDEEFTMIIKKMRPDWFKKKSA